MRRRSNEEIESRCVALEALGFEIDHIDVRVRLGEVILDAMPYESRSELRDFYINFSTIDESRFMAHAFQMVFEHGMVRGRDGLRRRFRDLMEFEEDQDE